MKHVESAYEKKGHELRAEIKAAAVKVKTFIKTSKDATPANGDDSERRNHSEMIANATLAYRHLEDAAMRIGKCLQADQGGVSILDKMREEPTRGGVPNGADKDDSNMGCCTETASECPACDAEQAAE